MRRGRGRRKLGTNSIRPLTVPPPRPVPQNPDTDIAVSPFVDMGESYRAFGVADLLQPYYLAGINVGSVQPHTLMV